VLVPLRQDLSISLRLDLHRCRATRRRAALALRRLRHLPHPTVDREPTDPQLLRSCAHPVRRSVLDRLGFLRRRVATCRCSYRSTRDHSLRHYRWLRRRDLRLRALLSRGLLLLLARPPAHATLRHPVCLRRSTHPEPRHVCERRCLFLRRVPAPLACHHRTPAIPQSGSGPSGISPRGNGWSDGRQAQIPTLPQTLLVRLGAPVRARRPRSRGPELRAVMTTAPSCACTACAEA
jgi:hypothetical protein